MTKKLIKKDTQNLQNNGIDKTILTKNETLNIIADGIVEQTDQEKMKQRLLIVADDVIFKQKLISDLIEEVFKAKGIHFNAALKEKLTKRFEKELGDE